MHPVYGLTLRCNWPKDCRIGNAFTTRVLQPRVLSRLSQQTINLLPVVRDPDSVPRAASIPHYKCGTKCFLRNSETGQNNRKSFSFIGLRRSRVSHLFSTDLPLP